jgi:hypothetical protein
VEHGLASGGLFREVLAFLFELIAINLAACVALVQDLASALGRPVAGPVLVRMAK